MPATSTKKAGQPVCYLGGKTRDKKVHYSLATAWKFQNPWAVMCVSTFSVFVSLIWIFGSLIVRWYCLERFFFFFFRGNQTESVGFSSEMTCLRVTLPLWSLTGLRNKIVISEKVLTSCDRICGHWSSASKPGRMLPSQVFMFYTEFCSIYIHLHRV